MLFALWHVQFTICLLFTLCRALGRPFEWWLATRRYNRINNVEKKKLVPFATSCVIWEDLNIIVGFPRYFHDVSMIFLWDYYLNSYGISFVVPMLFHVIFMIFLWYFCGVPMGFAWYFYFFGTTIGFLWDVD
jgi:hypothetical protein